MSIDVQVMLGIAKLGYLPSLEMIFKSDHVDCMTACLQRLWPNPFHLFRKTLKAQTQRACHFDCYAYRHSTTFEEMRVTGTIYCFGSGGRRRIAGKKNPGLEDL
jgi:hypothetical protein